MKRRWGSGSVTLVRGAWVPRLPRALGRGRLGRYDTEEEAAAVLAAALEELASAPGGETIGAWGRGWLERRHRAGAHDEARDDLRRWGRYVERSTLGPIALKSVDARAVRAWLRDTFVGLSPRTKRNALSLLRVVLEGAVVACVIDDNPARFVKVGERDGGSREKPMYTAAEVDDLLAAEIDAHRKTLLTVLVYTGLRPSEAWGLTWSAVGNDFVDVLQAVKEDGSLGATKNRRKRRVPLLEPARLALDEWEGLCRGKMSAKVWAKVRRDRLVFPRRDEAVHTAEDGTVASRWRDAERDRGRAAGHVRLSAALRGMGAQVHERTSDDG